MDILGQLQGPFEPNQNLIEPILKKYKIDYLFKIGIVAAPLHEVIINDNAVLIGKTGLFEVRDTPIYSIIFKQQEEANTFIDYMAKV